MRLEIDTDDHDVEGLIWEIADFTNTFIEEKTTPIPAVDLGLDKRIPNIRVGDNFIAVGRDSDTEKMLRHYGGFQYVEEDDIKYMGDYKFYFDSSDRVNDALFHYLSQVKNKKD